MLDRIRRVVRKPPRVVAYRALQEARLAWLSRSDGWVAIERSASAWARTRETRAPLLVAADAREAFVQSKANHALDVDGLLTFGARVASRNLTLLGSEVPASGAWPWHEDWRFARRWPARYFRDYEFYEARTEAYDVKYPWELSRLLFLLPVAQRALITGDAVAAASVMSVVRDWRDNNPLAHSVNWYPMEASMRTVALVLLLEMLDSSRTLPGEDVRELAALVAVHGEFISRTLEFNDVRGNHFAANIVALLLAGVASRGYAPAEEWTASAARKIEEEILSQILPDGVDFEKSMSYHRLVAELFVLAGIALQRANRPLGPIALDRLRRAVVFASAYTRPDGLAANYGDNDDGRVLQFDDVPARDHRSLIALGAAWLREPSAKTDRCSAAIPLLLGRDGLATWASLSKAATSKTDSFADGGYVVSRSNGNFFMIDVGEVGLAGRGGHGHNDMLSFELMIDATAVIVDSGSYLYTGDLQSRTWFQSTAAHNGMRIDGEEIAEIRGPWDIAPTAKPFDVRVATEEGSTVVRAGHVGYTRLNAIHRRECHFSPDTGTLRVVDVIASEGRHRAERFLHFPPSAAIDTKGTGATVTIGSRTVRIRWQDGDARIDSGWVSESYGLRSAAPVLVLENQTNGTWSSWFEISTAD